MPTPARRPGRRSRRLARPARPTARAPASGRGCRRAREPADRRAPAAPRRRSPSTLVLQPDHHARLDPDPPRFGSVNTFAVRTPRIAGGHRQRHGDPRAASRSIVASRGLSGFDPVPDPVSRQPMGPSRAAAPPPRRDRSRALSRASSVAIWVPGHGASKVATTSHAQGTAEKLRPPARSYAAAAVNALDCLQVERREHAQVREVRGRWLVGHALRTSQAG